MDAKLSEIKPREMAGNASMRPGTQIQKTEEMRPCVRIPDACDGKCVLLVTSPIRTHARTYRGLLPIGRILRPCVQRQRARPEMAA